MTGRRFPRSAISTVLLTAAWDILKGIERAPDPKAIETSLIDIGERFGFTSIFAGWVPPIDAAPEAEAVANQVVVSTMPEDWWSRYLEQRYIARDPIVQHLRSENAPFTWGEAYAHSRDSTNVKLIQGEAGEFGLREGFVVPVTLLGGLQLAFSFGARNLDAGPQALGTLAFATSLAAGHYLDFAVSARLNRPGMVSGRERDCLAWAAEGKTDWEIATILGISMPTVRKHLASARDKLQAVNKFHAVAIGFRTGLIR